MPSEAATVNPQSRRGAGGRPTREEAAKRDARLFEAATKLFLERGFDGATIDAVAEAAGISKPTLYCRYHDKKDLFEAVLKQRIQTWLAPLSAAAEEQIRHRPSQNLRSLLHHLSRAMLQMACTPESAAIHRTLAAQATRFPDLAALACNEGWTRAVHAMAVILRDFQRRGRVRAGEPEILAEIFMDLVLGPCSRAALYGLENTCETVETRRQAAVELFIAAVAMGRDAD